MFHWLTLFFLILDSFGHFFVYLWTLVNSTGHWWILLRTSTKIQTKLLIKNRSYTSETYGYLWTLYDYHHTPRHLMIIVDTIGQLFEKDKFTWKKLQLSRKSQNLVFYIFRHSWILLDTSRHFLDKSQVHTEKKRSPMVKKRSNLAEKSKSSIF